MVELRRPLDSHDSSQKSKRKKKISNSNCWKNSKTRTRKVKSKLEKKYIISLYFTFSLIFCFNLVEKIWL